MKNRKLASILIVALCVSMLCGCAGTSVQPIQGTNQGEIVESDTETEEADSVDDEKAAEEIEAEETKKAEEEKKAEEAKKVEEAKKAEEDARKAEAERLAKEAEEKLLSGLDEKVEVDKITRFDKEQTMYMQRAGNVRKGPSQNFDRVGSFDINEEVTVLGQYEEKGWYFVKFEDTSAFISNHLLDEEKVDLEALKAQQEAAAAAAAAQAQAQAAAQAQAQAAVQNQPAQQVAQTPAPAPKAVAAPAGILFIGDSRTCQMRAATGGGKCGWVCEYCTDYGWFEKTAVPTADPMIGAGTKVVICMGVNDPGSLYSYANLVNQKAAEWVARGAKVYYVSINPVTAPYEDKTIPIDSFNATMPSLLANVRWIDTASVVKQGGYVLEDGIHYDAAGNVNIFNMIVGCLR